MSPSGICAVAEERLQFFGLVFKSMIVARLVDVALQAAPVQNLRSLCRLMRSTTLSRPLPPMLSAAMPLTLERLLTATVPSGLVIFTLTGGWVSTLNEWLAASEAWLFLS